MNAQLNRRGAVKTAAVGAGLLLLGESTPAAEGERNNQFAGEWLNRGRLDQRCAIFQMGQILLLVNEQGSLATGRMTQVNQFVVVKGDGWDAGVVGDLVEGGRTIAWRGGGSWRRA
jgi:hypothetical protein